ncbi:division plane positioning ATPase MipZ [Parvibaculum sp.]|uniref:division plane positioning ATPase MipZ n=1 Tax=Parvibaculum sp. TaxID=2024848 RepID=UPI0025CC473F|nr:division plane positioning ATPase MipZ [Parvibaculum sp.]
MHVIAFASQKGGSGKTTLAGHIAVEAERVGAGPVALVDTSARQPVAMVERAGGGTAVFRQGVDRRAGKGSGAAEGRRRPPRHHRHAARHYLDHRPCDQPGRPGRHSNPPLPARPARRGRDRASV